MPNSKKKRKAKHSPNTAGTARRDAQQIAAQFNSQGKDLYNRMTPWEKAKAKRKHLGILAGKHTAWMRKQAAKSNYKQSGKDKVNAGTLSN